MWKKGHDPAVSGKEMTGDRNYGSPGTSQSWRSASMSASTVLDRPAPNISAALDKCKSGVPLFKNICMCSVLVCCQQWGDELEMVRFKLRALRLLRLLLRNHVLRGQPSMTSFWLHLHHKGYPIFECGYDRPRVKAPSKLPSIAALHTQDQTHCHLPLTTHGKTCPAWIWDGSCLWREFQEPWTQSVTYKTVVCTEWGRVPLAPYGEVCE